MEKLGLVERKVFPNETAIRIEYYPTEKWLALQSIIDMKAYSMKYCSKEIFKDGNQENSKRCMIEIFILNID